MGVYLFPFTSATILHFFLGVFLHFITGDDTLDTRIKATVASTMYDMSRVNSNGYFDAEDSEEARYAKRVAMNAQRLTDYQSGEYALGGGMADPHAGGRALLLQGLP